MVFVATVMTTLIGLASPGPMVADWEERTFGNRPPTLQAGCDGTIDICANLRISLSMAVIVR